MNDEFDLDALVKTGRSQKKASSAKKLEGNLIRPGLTDKQVAAAKGRNLVAGREPKSIRLPPDLREAIDAEAKAEPGYTPIGQAAGCGVFDMYHLLVAYAWEEYRKGNILVNVSERIQVRTTIEIPGYT